MTSSRRSSRFRPTPEAPSANFRWRPSRLLAGGLCLLGALAAVAAAVSAAPGWAKCLLVPLSAAAGLRLARGHLAQPGFDWQPTSGDWSLRLRGVLATLEGRDAEGRRRRWQYWPDTLAPVQRRAMRLMARHQSGSSAVALHLTT